MTTLREALTRRTFLALSALPLSGCGGGELLATLLPGTTGTGIVALASITGFGSVIVGGQTYDETLASMTIDGTPASRSDLRLGMTAKVSGTWLAETSTGVAQQIDVFRTASGTVSTVNTGSLVLHGQTFVWDSSTLWDGVSATTLQAGQAVIVWALQADSQATQWQLTRVASGDGGLLTVTGLLEQRNGLWFVGAIQLQQMQAFNLPVGQLVWVRGQQAIASEPDAWVVATARTAAITPEEAATAPLLHIEGVVTADASDNTVRVGNQTLDASALQDTPSRGQRVQVTVKRQPDGHLRIDTLTGSSTSNAAQPAIRLSGHIENWHSVADFTIQGQRCSASNATGDVQALAPGAWVSVTGTRQGAVVEVLTVLADSRQR